MDKSIKNQDPFAEREAIKYEHPIPSREFIMKYLQELGRPASRDHIIKAFSLTGEEEQEAMRRRLLAMTRDGQLICTRRGSYGLVDKMQLICGRVIGHPEGYGFLVPDLGGKDLYLSERQMRSVFHGDRVLVRERGLDRRGRREATVVEVLERNTLRLVGRLFDEDGITYVIPDNKRIIHSILIPSEHRGKARPGQIVEVEILIFPSTHTQALGKIVTVLGEHMAAGMETDIAIRAYGLPHEWPEEVQAEIAQYTKDVAETDKQNRTDIRHLPLVTIDGEDAKDFDDAVYCQRNPRGGWRLYVAIADVSHYVKPDTALDKSAYERGNSVYFPGRVIPMLPEILSNELCSLKPEVDRLCMVCEMTIGANGVLRRQRFYEGVMRSRARLTYTKVSKILEEGDAELEQEYAELIPHLRELYALYQVLRSTRETRGALDFETVETRIIFGKKRKIKEIVPVIRNEAHKLIEECMLAANVATARFLESHEIPALYRVHEPPKDEKLLDLRDFLGELGLRLPGGKQPKPGDFAALLKSIEGRLDAHLIQVVMLRSLKQAVYSPHNGGHFGLAYPAYAHFTSPIRRYPDLLVHRAIKHLIKHQPINTFAYTDTAMTRLGEHCSMTERRADEATRDVINWLKCEYIQDRVGEEFEGIVSGVTGFGLFVELQGIYVEGLVHITDLQNDYYTFDPKRHYLMGERTRKMYRLGDKIRVRIARVDLDERKIDFVLA